MARQKGLIKLNGTMGDITFYKSIDGFLAREKGGVEGSRIATDAAFVRTRENNAEFGNSALAGKLLRKTVRPLSKNTSDCRMTARMTKVMAKVKNMDKTSVRGKRNVATGMATAEGKELMKGFNFNANAPLESVLHKSFELVPLTGEITISPVVTLNDVGIPQGTTHILFKAGLAVVDFETGKTALAVSAPARLPIAPDQEDVDVIPPPVPTATGTKFYLLSIEFIQEVNGADYPLQNGAFNVLNIVEVL